MNHLIAAVDLGSNSFRLAIGRVVEEGGTVQVYPVDRLKETVRLAAGLKKDNTLDTATTAFAIEVLKRFGERLRSFDPDRVRAVATNTFRVARNVAEFLPTAEAALGFPIEIIAGREEARLIFTGVTHSLPFSPNKRLVVDIGGGSTELIVGRHFEPELMESLYMGCVSYSRSYFADGIIDAHTMKQAEIAARREIESIARRYRKSGWQEAYGSSGTSKALSAILTASGFSEQGITRRGMDKLKDRLIKAGTVERAQLADIKTDRMSVLPGGLAIMSAIFDELKIDVMHTADGALRVGVLYDLLGRDAAHDKRDDTVMQFMTRYKVDRKQAARVKKTALSLFQAALPAPPPAGQEELSRLLGWTADLHEIGLSIAHSTYHRHTAYVLENADMPGFSKQDQSALALLALSHQGKLSKVQALVQHSEQWIAILCLRLAVVLCRRREDLAVLPLRVSVKGSSIIVRIDADWANDNPLTDFTLRAEESEWRKVGFTFELLQL